MSFASIIDLRVTGESAFTGAGAGAGYPWDFLYGGHVIAQSIRAAASTVRSEEAIQSLHAYYLRAGDAAKELTLVVESVRDGRSFSVRSVSAMQDARLVARVLASFHIQEGGAGRSTAPPARVMQPEGLASESWNALFDRRYVPTQTAGRALAWMRLGEPVADDPVAHACGLAYLADDLFDDSARGVAGAEAPITTESLDLSIWFHRPARVDGWLLHDYRCASLANACAMVNGDVFRQDGTHLATVAQQVLVRRPDRTTPTPQGREHASA
jgi:acyl-CoA thioesterase II